jgi:hypothetical protein
MNSQVARRATERTRPVLGLAEVARLTRARPSPRRPGDPRISPRPHDSPGCTTISAVPSSKCCTSSPVTSGQWSPTLPASALRVTYGTLGTTVRMGLPFARMAERSDGLAQSPPERSPRPRPSQRRAGPGRKSYARRDDGREVRPSMKRDDRVQGQRTRRRGDRDLLGHGRGERGGELSAGVRGAAHRREDVPRPRRG